MKKTSLILGLASFLFAINPEIITPSAIENQIIKIQNLPLKERVQKMNELKNRLRHMNEQKREIIIRKIAQKHHIENYRTESQNHKNIKEFNKNLNKNLDNKQNKISREIEITHDNIIERHETDYSYLRKKDNRNINTHHINFEKNDRNEKNTINNHINFEKNDRNEKNTINNHTNFEKNDRRDKRDKLLWKNWYY